MENRVVAADGHTYERRAIARWLVTRDTSPVTNLRISKQLVPNVALRSMISGWRQRAHENTQPVADTTTKNVSLEVEEEKRDEKEVQSFEKQLNKFSESIEKV